MSGSGDGVDLSRVAVVIVTYASATHISQCLATLPLEDLGGVVVVDNDSPDDTVDVVQGLDLPGVRLVEQENVGFGGGCNTGVRYAPESCDLVLFLNPDARLDRHNLEVLVSYLADRPSCALAAPRLRCGDRAQTSAGALPTLASEVRPLLPSALGSLLPRRALPAEHAGSGPVGYVEGACMLVRRSAFDRLGGFDESYFLCFEEIDLARRLSAQGWEVELCAAAWAEHCSGASRASVALGGNDHALAGRLRYLETHRGHGTRRTYAAVARASLWLRRRTGRLDKPSYERFRQVLTAQRRPRA